MEDQYTAGFCIRSASHARGCGGGGGGTGTKCGRWNPTSEQVKVLTELFRSGLRTPSTDQIQKISSQLSFYGKIESKNVFYWFQNHKARERQKRRRVSVDDDEQHDSTNKFSSTKYFGETISPVSVSVSVSEPERVIETLQLFPLSGPDHSEKLRVCRDDCKENSNSSFTCINIDSSDQIDNHYHPTLDLRLSFV